MKDLHQGFCRSFALLMVLLGSSCDSARAQNMHLEGTTAIAQGVHLWYEIKADPEQPNNLILCGTRWDALANNPYGFVYASWDTGATWQAVLEDRNSPWVTEHSCAFGLKHHAYFISEASKVFDGEQHHNLGVTRLFVSVDAGKHWTETNKTGWADFSTSAVSSVTGRLYTFFNDPSASDPGRNRGNSVGLLLFSPDGAQMAGSFFLPEMRDLNYEGVYPSDAVALKSGDVSALYYGARRTKTGLEGELGFIRADKSAEPSLKRVVISRGPLDNGCWSSETYALAYDRERNRLSVLYVEGCKTTRLMLTSSDDEGRTWTKSVAVAQQEEGKIVMYPSLVASSDGVLSLLWSEWNKGSGRWLFAQIRDTRLVEPPVELPPGAEALTVSNDSLWTTVHRSKEVESEIGSTSSGPPITISVRGLVDVVWRSNGLIAVRDRILAIWPSGGPEGTRLNSGILSPFDSVATGKKSGDLNKTADPDATQNSVITYGGRQIFDRATGTLTVCLALANRGTESIHLPITLEATDIQSPAGVVSILNATNGLRGAGARWNISDSVTGDRLAPGTKTNPFCLSVHVDGLARNASPFDEDIVALKLRVMESTRRLSGETEP
jgi:hypothetical protein